jgi:hypothetical protein
MIRQQQSEIEELKTKTLTDEDILREAYYILLREQQKKASEK